MIVNYTPPEARSLGEGREPYFSPWDRGMCTVAYPAIHGGERMAPWLRSFRGSTTDRLLRAKWLTWDIDSTVSDKLKLPTKRIKALIAQGVAENRNGDWDYFANDVTEWGSIGLFTGNVADAWALFYLWAMDLDPECDPACATPSGDDDAYDYYPASFEGLGEMAADLDNLDAQYVAVGGKGRSFTARQRVVTIVRNLRYSRGPFEEWEFEDYAAPYLAEARLPWPTIPKETARA